MGAPGVFGENVTLTVHLGNRYCLCHNLFRWSKDHRSLSATLVGEHNTGPRGYTLWAFNIMPTKICVMLDGGYVRALCKQTNRPPKDPAYIEKIAKACQAQDEVIHRIMFYDSGGFTGTAKQPVSGQVRQFTANDRWLHELSYKDLFSIRLGVLKFRSFVLNPARIP